MYEDDASTRDAHLRPHLSVVIPVFNSERILPALLHRLLTTLDGISEEYEIVFVEDCGPDDAWRVLRDLARSNDRVRAVQLLRNSGQGAATLCGISQARGDIIVTMDDDLQHPPEEIPRLLETLESQPETDVIMAVPYRKQHALGRRLGSNWMNAVNSYLLDKPRDLRLSGFRLIRRRVGEGLLQFRVPHPAIGPLVLQLTNRVINVPFEHAERAQGKSNYTPSRLIRQILSNVIGFSMLPLRTLALIGAVGAAFSVVFAIYLLVRYFVVGVGVAGWMSLALMLSAMFGFVFFAFGIVGEYLLRITRVVSGTPAFSIRAEIDRRSIQREDHSAQDAPGSTRRSSADSIRREIRSYDAGPSQSKST